MEIYCRIYRWAKTKRWPNQNNNDKKFKGTHSNNVSTIYAIKCTAFAQIALRTLYNVWDLDLTSRSWQIKMKVFAKTHLFLLFLRLKYSLFKIMIGVP